MTRYFNGRPASNECGLTEEQMRALPTDTVIRRMLAASDNASAARQRYADCEAFVRWTQESTEYSCEILRRADADFPAVAAALAAMMPVPANDDGSEFRAPLRRDPGPGNGGGQVAPIAPPAPVQPRPGGAAVRIRNVPDRKPVASGLRAAFSRL